MKKLSVSLLAVILLSIICLGWIMDILFERYLVDENTGPLSEYKQLGQQLAHLLNDSIQPTQLLKSWNLTAQNPAEILLSADLPLPEPLQQSFQQGEVLVLETNAGLTLYYWLEQHQRILAFTPSYLQQSDDMSYSSLALTSIFYLAILLLLGLWLIPLIRSLSRLRANALAYGRGDFTARIGRGQFTYLDDIEQVFNRMAEQIATLIQDNKLISSAVSHDLRTPLARLRFGLDMLAETEDEEERQKYQEHLSNDIDEMQSLVEALLNYAKLEQALIQLQKGDVDVAQILIAFQKSHPKGLIEIEVDENLTVAGEQTYLRMLLHNILNNALNYGHGRVLVIGRISAKHLLIDIHDDGEGVPENQRDTLFKPFVRGEMSKHVGGYGMGLAIAERIAHWHDGAIEVLDSDRLSGALFRLRLPMA